MTTEEVCPLCHNTNGEHKPGCALGKPKRIGRPKGDGTHRNIGVYGTPAEIATVLDNLTPRERMEAMLKALPPFDYFLLQQGKE